jgi:hypothetical protein
LSDYQPREAFMPLHLRENRWSVIVAHRRAGKTVSCINDLLTQALSTTKENARYAYIAPYYSQAKQIAWDYLKRYGRSVATKVSESELSIDLTNGSRIRLFGADNADALRGMYLDGVVLDEYGDMRPSVWGEVIRPLLADRKGWAVFIGTPKGRNHFYDIWQSADEKWFKLSLKASESGLLDQGELDDARNVMTRDQYLQEFECSFEAAVVGAIYANELDQARTEGRIGKVPYEPIIPVHTVWDLGVSDATTIWFWQQVGREIRVIDYYEHSGEGLPHYVKYLQSKPYVYGSHYAPHDIAVREFATGMARIDVARDLGVNFLTVPRQSLEDGIHGARLFMARCWFDEERCREGLDALANYRREFDEKRGVFRSAPVHDWASHGADSWRYMSLCNVQTSSTPIRRKLSVI